MPLAALKKKSAPAKPAAKAKPISAPPMLSPPAWMQTKLEVGPVGDRFEQEADRTADSVMRMPSPAMPIAAAPLQISRKCAVCEQEEKDDKRLQKKSAGPAEANIGEALASVHAALRSPGQPLDKASRAYFEPRFGQEFGDVRVHTGMIAAQSARDVSAHAYTVGQNIVFAAGRFAPATQTGRRLIAHELTHVVQQSGGVSAGVLQRAPAPMAGNPSAIEPLEVIAQRIARLALGPHQKSGQFPRGPVLSVVRDTQSGEIFVGFNTGIPKKLTEVMSQALSAHKEAISQGKVEIVHTIEPGGHGEVVALNRAVAAREAATNRTVTKQEMGTFELHNVWLKEDRELQTAPRCEHCEALTEGVRVTRSLYIAENPVSATTPPAATTSGEFIAKPPGPRGPPPQGPAPAIAAHGAEVASGQNVTEGFGVPVEPISVPEPVGRIGATKAGAEAAGAMLLATLLNRLRSAELQKAVDRLKELLPEIDNYRKAGNDVIVTMIVEVPNQVDIAALIAGIGTQDQVVYFKRMFISSAVKHYSTPPAYTTMTANLASGDPERRDPHEYTLEQQIKLQMGEKYPVPGTEPQKGFHFVSADLPLPAFTAGGQTAPPAAPERDALKGIAGRYSAKFESIFIGSAFLIPLLVNRYLQIDQDANGRLTPKMWQPGPTPFSYLPYAPHGHIVISGRFAVGQGTPPDATWIYSNMEYPREGLILEWVKGMDAGLNTTWDALVSWHKVS